MKRKYYKIYVEYMKKKETLVVDDLHLHCAVSDICLYSSFTIKKIKLIRSPEGETKYVGIVKRNILSNKKEFKND